jgi:hypothetical protein
MYIEAKLDPKKNAWIELEGNVIIVGVKKKAKNNKIRTRNRPNSGCRATF